MTQACFGDHHHVTLPRQGIRLHYVASGDVKKPVMLLLHGFPEFWYSWRHQIKHFNNKYRVIAVDLTGYGGSSKPQAVERYTVQQLVEDIREFIETLEIGPCVVVAHDWGGAITWALTSLYPELVSKAAILNCPHPAAMVKYAQSSWKQLMKSWYMFFVNLPYFPEWFFSTGDLQMLKNTFQGRQMGANPGAVTTEDLEAYKYTFNKPSDFTGPMNYIRATIQGMNFNEEFPRIQKTPILLVWGTRDAALSREMAPLSASYAVNFRLEYIEGASHWVQQDEPDKVNQFIEQFLQEK